MDVLTIELAGVIFLLMIALAVILRLAAEEIVEDVAEFKRRNRWRKRNKHRRHK